jgi:NAD(P)-dependent dehydrogenase (short-subunit alcohol dehydrogenase family)
MAVLDKNKKIAVVTGAGGTLCSAMALALAQQGIAVALLGRDLGKLEDVREKILLNEGFAIAISTDVTSEREVLAANDLILRQMGVPSILINGAGGNQAAAVTDSTTYEPEELTEETERTRGFLNMDLRAFESVLQTNTMGTVIPCQIFGKEMAKKGGGAIINIASMNSFRPLSRVGAYGMAKAGIANFTQWLASYLAPANIRVNAIAPGFFVNDRSRRILFTEDGSYSERGNSILRQTPLKRFGDASELIGCMNWLVSEENAGFVTGTVIPVDGGFLANSGI